MINLTEQMEQNIGELENILNMIEDTCRNAPKGILRISKSKQGKSRYYHKYVENATGKVCDRYISKKANSKLIEQLAQKQYLSSLKPILENELCVLQRMKKHYFPEEKEKVFEKLSVDRKKL